MTALYTSQAWRWGGFDGAELLATDEAERVFRVTNAALRLAGRLGLRGPSLRHSLVQRHAMFAHLLDATGAPQVLELAAGLSQHGISATRNAEVSYVEVDLAPVVAKKRQLLERTAAGRRVAARPNWRLVAGDVHEVDLDGLIDPARPVFVIAEGLCMYLDAAEQRALWRKIADLVGRNARSRFAFDLVPTCEQPRPGRVGRTLESAMKYVTGGKSFVRDERTRVDMVRDLKDCGFAAVTALEPADMEPSWAWHLPDQKTQVLVFCCTGTASTSASKPA